MHSDCRWGEWVVGREDEGAPVLAIVIWGIGRTGENIMPPRDGSVLVCLGVEGYALEDVAVGGVGGDEWRGILCDVLVFSC